MTQTVGGAEQSGDGRTFPVTIASLGDTADIVNAFKYYHQGGTTGSATTNSIEKYLIDIWGTAGDTASSSLLNLKNWTGYSSTIFNSKGSISTRLLSIEGILSGSGGGGGLDSRFVKMTPTANSGDLSNLITAGNSATVPLIAKGATSQSVNLQEWQTQSSTVGYINNLGIMYSTAYTNALQTTSAVSEVVTLSGFQTLTNKTLTAPVINTQIDSKTTAYALLNTDNGKIVEMNSASAINVTVSLDSTSNFPVGASVVVLQTGAGQVTIAPAVGVTVNATPGLKLRTQWSAATLVKRAANTWVAFGDLSA